jgi:hypothetical protein
MEDRFRQNDGKRCMDNVERLAFKAIEASQSAPTQAPAASKKEQDPFHAVRCARIDCRDVNFYTSAIAKYANGTHTCLVKEIQVFAKSRVLEQGAVLVDAPGTSIKLFISHEILINVGFGDISVMGRYHAHCIRSADKYLVVSKNGEAPIDNTDMLHDCIHGAPNGAQAVTLVITHPDVRSLSHSNLTVC